MSGWVDGLSLAFALAAGMSSIAAQAQTILLACLALTIAGALTMTAGGYMTAKTYQSDPRPLRAALAIGCGYLAGGLLICVSYMGHAQPLQLLQRCCLIALPALAVAGWLDNTLNGATGWTGALRVLLIGGLAAASAYGVAQLFR